MQRGRGPGFSWSGAWRKERRMRVLTAIALGCVMLFTSSPLGAAERVKGAELINTQSSAEEFAPALQGLPFNQQEVDLFLGAIEHLERWALKNIRAWNSVAGAQNSLEALKGLGAWKSSSITWKEFFAVSIKLGHARAMHAGEVDLDAMKRSLKTNEELLGSKYSSEQDKQSYKKRLAEVRQEIASFNNYPAANLTLYEKNKGRIDKALMRVESLSLTGVASKGDVRRVGELIAAGADPSTRDQYGWTVLMWAAARGDADMARLVVKAGAQINMRNVYGHTALVLAADSQSREVVKLLVNTGANLNAREDSGLGYTALHYAVSRGDEDLVRLLVDGGANLNVLNGSGESPLVMAANKGYTEIAELLRQAGADPNMKDRLGTSPIQHALRRGNDKAVEILVGVGADIEERNKKFGQTLLIQQVMLGTDDAVALLLRLGADPNAPDKDGSTALSWASFMSSPRKVELLIKGGADLNSTDDKGWTPLMSAAAEGRGEVARMLVDAGADIRHESDSGLTALSIATRKGNQGLMALFSTIEYLGCFKDQGDPYGTAGRDISGYKVGSSDMTVQKCTETCGEKGFSYAGVQYGKQCFCGDSYGSSGGASNCNMPCSGDSAQICGGFWANSVYKLKDTNAGAGQGRKSISWLAKRGQWTLENNIMIQRDISAKPALVVAENFDLPKYTLTLKARKTGGAEGFLIVFHFKNDSRWLWWNLGGWGNTKSAIEYDKWGWGKVVRGTSTRDRFKTGQWYEIKITVDGHRFMGYIDGVLRLDVSLPGNLSASGNFGLATWSTTAEFANINIQ